MGPHWDIGYLILYLDHNLSYNSFLNIWLNLFRCLSFKPREFFCGTSCMSRGLSPLKIHPRGDRWNLGVRVLYRMTKDKIVQHLGATVKDRCSVIGVSAALLSESWWIAWRPSAWQKEDTSEWPATDYTMWCEARPPTWVKALRHLPRYSAHTHRTCLLPLPARQYRPAAPQRECTDSESVTSLYITSGWIKVSFYVEEGFIKGSQ